MYPALSPISHINCIGTLYSTLKYREDFNISGASLVNLQIDRSVFDYCSLASYTLAGVQPLLDMYKVNTSAPNATWVAFYNEYSITDNCKDKASENFDLFWVQRMVKLVQQLGATAQLVSYTIYTYNNS